MTYFPGMFFLDKDYLRVGRDIVHRLQFRGDQHKHKITFPNCHVKDEHLYCESVLTLKNGRELSYPFAIELNEVLLEGHKADDIAEHTFNEALTNFENALDFYGDSFSADDIREQG